MVDRLNIGIYKVDVTPVTGKAQQKVLARLDLMEREMQHLQRAIHHVRQVVRQPSLQTHAPLADAVMDLRNWMLSVVMSESYVQYMFWESPTSGNSSPYYLGTLANRAVQAGADDADRDRLLSQLL